MASDNIIKSQISGTLQNMFSATGVGNTYAAATSTETAFLLNTGLVSGTVSGVGGIGGSGTVGFVPLALGNPQDYFYAPGSTFSPTQQSSGLTPAWVGRSFKIRAQGSVTAGSGMSLTIKLYQVTAAAIAAGGQTATSFSTGATNIATTGSLSVASVSTNFELEAVVQISSTGQLNGRQVGHVNATIVSAAVLTNQATGLIGEADLNFFVTSAWSAGSSSGTVVLNELSIEQV